MAMLKYVYKAMDERGKVSTGNVEAANLEDLELRLRRMELDLISYKEKHEKSIGGKGRTVTRKDLIMFCYHLEQLSRAGVPLVDGLGDLRDGIDNIRFREIVSALIESIEGGKKLSQALAEFPRVFDQVFVNLVSAGEESGQLVEVLVRITESLKWQDELAAKAKKIVLYPAFVGFVVILVIFFLMIYLVPQLISFVKNMGHELPLHTKVLIAVSNAFVGYWHVIAGTPIVLIAALKYAMYVSYKVRFKVDEIKLKIWLIGPILRMIILARFANYFSLLYSAGVTVLESFRISEGIAGNLAISEALKQARSKIEEGNSIGAAVESVELFPPLVLRMLKMGETTGAIDKALDNVSYFYNREVKESIEKVESVIEPVLTVVLGAILGWVMLSVLGPLYDIISKIDI